LDFCLKEFDLNNESYLLLERQSMSQLESIVLLDAETTPVAHTFVPQAIKDGVAALKESDGVPLGDNYVTLSIKDTPAYYKVRALLSVPQVVNETINGVTVPSVVRTAYANIDLRFDKQSTVQERQNLAAMASDLLSGGNNLIASTIHDLEGIF